MMMLCDECDMWRLLYRRTKLKKTQCALLESLLDNYSYTYGSSLQNIELPEPFKEVYKSIILVVTNQLKSCITQQGMIQFVFTVLKKLQYKMQTQNFIHNVTTQCLKPKINVLHFCTYSKSISVTCIFNNQIITYKK